MSNVERSSGKIASVDELRPAGNHRTIGGESLPSSVAHRARPARTLQVNREQLETQSMIVPAVSSRQSQDEFRRIKRKLLEMLPRNGKGWRELLVTSSVPAEGKTFFSFHLALSFAQERDHGVLLIDGDLARPRMTSVFGLMDAPGLTDLLMDDSMDPFDVVLETSIKGLWFLPAGHASAQAPELIASARMTQLRERFAQADPARIVLYDSPPVLASNEAQALAQLIDKILMVVRAESTPPGTVREALSVIGEDRGVVCVLNGVRNAPGQDYYGYGYGSGDDDRKPKP